ncbi:Tat pathway signal protein [Coleofasciculus sp. FACHB-1120]|uniref:Tat pathway signal protein n=1 Tax=Coleofasciculus sp. FACHB-1120 TaxID=2692783 RepID=UPI00168953FC|nr:Tat pathway signal protein [Coleofasciculus sp. FACHB-1120]MBD2740935.1 Tat pathway signal protein [Coleofasciculus sp. FACHB-1120]
MTLNRRKFTRIALIGGASFAASSGIFFPKPSEAVIWGLALRGLTAPGVFGSLVRFAAGRVIRGALSGAFGPSQEELLQIQLADKDFIERRFTQNRTQFAQAESTIFWGQQRQDKWGPNVGFGFVQEYQDEISTAKISGPTMTGIHVASQFLAKQGLSPSEVAGSLMPVRSQFDDWGTWEGDNDPSIGASYGVGFTNYLTLLGEVTSRYDLIQPGRGGRGEVQLIVEAGGQPRRDIIVQVKFS